MYHKYAESLENTILKYEQYKNERRKDFKKRSYGVHFEIKKKLINFDVKIDKIIFNPQIACHTTF